MFCLSLKLFLTLLTKGPPGEQGPRGRRGEKGEKVCLNKLNPALNSITGAHCDFDFQKKEYLLVQLLEDLNVECNLFSREALVLVVVMANLAYLVTLGHLDRLEITICLARVE